MSHPDWGDWGTPLAAGDGADDGELYDPITYERNDTPPTVPEPAWPVSPGPARPTWTATPPPGPPTRVDAPPLPVPRPVAQDPAWPPRGQAKPRPPRWMLAASAALIVAAGAGGTALALAGSPSAAASRPAQRAGSGLTPPVTLAAARGILSRYTAGNNTANARMNAGLLGSIETGTSQAIDSGAYLVQRAERAGPTPAFAPATARFYIPREPAASPRWFAVAVTNRALGGQHPALGTGYLLFTQASAGAPWKVAAGPFLLTGAGAAPVALGPGGYATMIAPDASGLAAAPSRIAAETAQSLDGHGPVLNPDPGSLTDSRAVTSQRPDLPPGSAVSDTHAPARYGTVGLRTADGGALLFYTDTATVTYQAPPGQAFTMNVPGFYDPGQPLHRAGLRILDQFATYDPPAGHGAPRVVAAFSGIQGKL